MVVCMFVFVDARLGGRGARFANDVNGERGGCRRGQGSPKIRTSGREGRSGGEGEDEGGWVAAYRLRPTRPADHARPPGARAPAAPPRPSPPRSSPRPTPSRTRSKVGGRRGVRPPLSTTIAHKSNHAHSSLALKRLIYHTPLCLHVSECFPTVLIKCTWCHVHT